ncbi:MAG: sigma-70 family RNA polymerase sigma factor [Myxococcota bacterium]
MEPTGDDEYGQAWMAAALARWEGPLTRYALRTVGDLELARDVVQDTFLRLWQADRAEIEPRLAAWLFTVCRNRAVDVARREGRMDAADARDGATAREESPLATLERKETAGSILDALATLPERQQEIVRLKFQDGLSYREIGEVLTLSESNVGFILHTTMRALRASLVGESGGAR